jgi:hypothetical protein
MVMSGLWDFLSDPANRAILTWLGGGLVVLAGGIWTVVKFFKGQKRAISPQTSRTKVRAEGGGIGGGRDVRIQTSHGISGGQLLALVAIIVGAVLLAAGLLGDRVTAKQGSIAIGGDVSKSSIKVNGGPEKDAP